MFYNSWLNDDIFYIDSIYYKMYYNWVYKMWKDILEKNIVFYLKVLFCCINVYDECLFLISLLIKIMFFEMKFLLWNG